MKLAEALINRADAQKRIGQLQMRLNRSALVQEGENPPEDPQELLAELDRTLAEFTRLVKQINRTNAATLIDDSRTITDALADRDTLMTERNMLAGVINAATNQSQMRYSRSEIKVITTMNIRELQARVDDLSRRYRELDSLVQQINWQVDLLEDA